jgi:hypothetical protein
MSIAGHASTEMSRKYVHDTSDDGMQRAGALLEGVRLAAAASDR